MKRKKTVPQVNDLVVWWIFYKLDGVPPEALTPDLLYEWHRHVMGDATRHPGIHAELYSEIEEYRARYVMHPFTSP